MRDGALTMVETPRSGQASSVRLCGGVNLPCCEAIASVVSDLCGKLVATAEVCHQSWQLKVLTTNLPRGLVVPVIFGRGWSMGQVVSQDKPARSPASAAMTTNAHHQCWEKTASFIA